MNQPKAQETRPSITANGMRPERKRWGRSLQPSPPQSSQRTLVANSDAKQSKQSKHCIFFGKGGDVASADPHIPAFHQTEWRDLNDRYGHRC